MHAILHHLKLTYPSRWLFATGVCDVKLGFFPFFFIILAELSWSPVGQNLIPAQPWKPAY